MEQLPRPSGISVRGRHYGDVIIEQFRAGDEWHIRIREAAPQIYIAEELLRLVAAGECDRCVWLDVPMFERPDGLDHLVGSVLHIDAVNQKLVYVITGYDVSKRWYTAEWPD